MLLELRNEIVLAHLAFPQSAQKQLRLLLKFLPLHSQLLQLFLQAPVFLLHHRVVLLVFDYLQVFLTALPGRQHRIGEGGGVSSPQQFVVAGGGLEVFVVLIVEIDCLLECLREVPFYYWHFKYFVH